jgi:predicted PurR-regulated permease PerM
MLYWHVCGSIISSLPFCRAAADEINVNIQKYNMNNDNEDQVSAATANDDNAASTNDSAHDSAAVAATALPPPVNARGLCLAILTAVAVVFALSAAHKFFIPLLFGIFIAYTLNPVVVWLERIRIPRLFGTSFVIVILVSGGLFMANNLKDEFTSIVVNMPTATHKLVRAIQAAQRGQVSTIEQVQNAANAIEKATNQAAGVKPQRTPEQSVLNLKQLLWAGSLGAISFIGQVTMVIFLVFFFLLSGDTFKRKLVRISGSTMSSRKITVHILDGINKSIQNYMFMLLITNVLFAVLLWIAFRLIGLENPGAWAVAAGFLHVIPYFGPLLIMVATGISAFMQFGTISAIVAVVVATLVISTIVGTFVTTWMTGRIAKMNTAAVFVSLLFWAWLWGIWGLLLGIPITVIVKVISEHADGLQGVAELLGE